MMKNRQVRIGKVCMDYLPTAGAGYPDCRESIAGGIVFSRKSGPDGTVRRPHCHDVFEVFFALSDGIRCFVNDQVYPVARGDILLFNARDIHAVVPAANSGYDRIVLTFPPEAVEGLSAGDTDLLACFLDRRPGFSWCVKPPPDMWAELMELCTEGETADHERGFGWEVRRRLCLGGILLRVNSACRQPGGCRADGRLPPDPRILPVIRRIRADPAADLSRESLASSVYLSPGHLSRLFRDATGIGLHEYAARCRIELAKDLLARGTGVTACAARTGFGSAACLIRSFRERTGMTPKQYALRSLRMPPPALRLDGPDGKI